MCQNMSTVALERLVCDAPLRVAESKHCGPPLDGRRSGTASARLLTEHWRCRARLDRIETLKRREKPEGLAAGPGLTMGAKKARMGDTLKALDRGAADLADTDSDEDDGADDLLVLDWRAKKSK